MVGGVLNRKLWRDLWRIRGQVIAIGLIMASGIGVLVMGLSTVEALEETARAYYERYRFAQVFARKTDTSPGAREPRDECGFKKSLEIYG